MDNPTLKFIIEVGGLLTILVGCIYAYFKARGSRLGVRDLVFFAPINFVVDYGIYICVANLREGGLYQTLILGLFLIGLIPIAFFTNIVFLGAVFASSLKDTRILAAAVAGVLCIPIYAYLNKQPSTSATPSEERSEPKHERNLGGNGKIAGENWAAENDPTVEECKKRAPNKDYLKGCLMHARKN